MAQDDSIEHIFLRTALGLVDEMALRTAIANIKPETYYIDCETIFPSVDSYKRTPRKHRKHSSLAVPRITISTPPHIPPVSHSA